MGRNLDDGTTTVLKSIKRDMEELKNRQFIGAHNLLVYVGQSANPYDLTFTLASGATKRVDFLFTPAHQDYMFYNLAIGLWVDSVSEANKANPFAYQIQANINYGEVGQTRQPVIISNNYGVTKTFFLKFYLRMSDDGTAAVSIIT